MAERCNCDASCAENRYHNKGSLGCIHAPPPASDGEVHTIAHDGFTGTLVGRYVTREGKRGVVLQQVGTKVVHVYGEKWLVTPPASRAGPVMCYACGSHAPDGECDCTRMDAPETQRLGPVSTPTASPEPVNGREFALAFRERNPDATLNEVLAAIDGEIAKWPDGLRESFESHTPAEPLCEDEGCPHHGTPHVCVSPPASPAATDDEVAALLRPFLVDDCGCSPRCRCDEEGALRIWKEDARDAIRTAFNLLETRNAR